MMLVNGRDQKYNIRKIKTKSQKKKRLKLKLSIFIENKNIFKPLFFLFYSTQILILNL